MNDNTQEMEQETRSTPDVRDRARELAEEANEIYDRAKVELQDAIARLRDEMDRLDVEQARLQAQQWVRDNPGLAALVALGGGVLFGRLLLQMFRDASDDAAFYEAPRSTSLSARVKDRASEFGENLAESAGEIGAVLGSRARSLGDDTAARVSHAVDRLQEAADDFARQVGLKKKKRLDLGDVIADAVKAAFAGAAVKKFTDFTQKLT